MISRDRMIQQDDTSPDDHDGHLIILVPQDDRCDYKLVNGLASEKNDHPGFSNKPALMYPMVPPWVAIFSTGWPRYEPEPVEPEPVRTRTGMNRNPSEPELAGNGLSISGRIYPIGGEIYPARCIRPDISIQI